MIFFSSTNSKFTGKGTANNFDGFIWVCNDCLDLSVQILVKATTCS